MKRIVLCLYILVLFFILLAGLLSAQTIIQPLRNVKIQARVAVDENGAYNYYYKITNPKENKLDVTDVAIDLTLPNYNDNADIWERVRRLSDANDYFYSSLQARIKGVWYIPAHWEDTRIWRGGTGSEDGRWSLIGKARTLTWETKFTHEAEYRRYLLKPGQTSEELNAISCGLPGIRKVAFKPDHVLFVDAIRDQLQDEENDDQAFISNRIKIESFGYLGITIGPSPMPVDSQLEQILQDYINQSVKLGWLNDAKLEKQLSNYIQQYTLFMQKKRPEDALNNLKEFLNSMNNAGSQQITSEAYALLYFNAKYFYDQKTGNLGQWQYSCGNNYKK